MQPFPHTLCREAVSITYSALSPREVSCGSAELHGKMKLQLNQ